MILFRRAFLALFGLTVAAGLAVGGPAHAADPTGYINSLGGRVIELVKDPAADKTRVRSELREIFRQSVDTASIGKFVLGRHWRSATEEQRTEFGRLFENMVIDSYADRFMQYSGETLTVSGSRAEGDEVLVKSVIDRPASDPVQADWRLVPAGDSYRIIDVVVAGVSMRITHRSEFSSVIQSNGGSIDGLLAHMRKRYGG